MLPGKYSQENHWLQPDIPRDEDRIPPPGSDIFALINQVAQGRYQQLAKDLGHVLRTTYSSLKKRPVDQGRTDVGPLYGTPSSPMRASDCCFRVRLRFFGEWRRY